MDEDTGTGKTKSFFRSNFCILLGVAAGCLIGVYVKPLAALLAPFGKMYVSALMMCIIPLIVLTLTSGVARLVHIEEIRNNIPLLIGIFVGGLFIPSLTGVIAAMVTGPGRGLGIEALTSLGEMVIDTAPAQAPSGDFVHFIVSIVPYNIFDSLSRGHYVSIVFSCVLVGLALGLVHHPRSRDILDFFDVLTDSFVMIFNWVVYLLPVGICLVFAGQISGFSPTVFTAFLKFIQWFYVVALLLCLFYFSCFRWMVGTSFTASVKALKEPLVLTFTVDSSFVALSSCLEALTRELRVNKRIGSIILPFGFIANKHGKILLFAFVSVFLAQVYDIDLGPGELAMIVIASSLSGMAAVGGGILLVPAMAPILHASGIPDALAPMLLLTLQPVADRMQSVVTVLANCTFAAIVGKTFNLSSTATETDITDGERGEGSSPD